MFWARLCCVAESVSLLRTCAMRSFQPAATLGSFWTGGVYIWRLTYLNVFKRITVLRNLTN
jgi:hypothetical protein